MEFKYSQDIKDESRTAKGMGTGLNISFKHAVAVCEGIRGMKLSDSINLLESVISHKKAIPFRRFMKGIGHRKGKEKVAKYPEKASSEILNVLRNIQANAEYKGLETDKLKLVHIQAQKGISRRKIKPKGRWRLWRTQLVNVQAIAKET